MKKNSYLRMDTRGEKSKHSEARRLAMCEGKVGYTSFEQASKYAHCNVYRCHFCKLWHRGRSNK